MAHSGKAEPVAARGDGLLPVHLKPPLQARALGFVEDRMSIAFEFGQRGQVSWTQRRDDSTVT
eukprot:CAMPEP_0174363236 /NCGR_PEP_ID=MMETSP0811_2-20130205/68036_1 /TAXON_ID=73025 ORGANISM="Eutreptiella gymnastica-like, Strain CCMP1594" /NCGR_SAMPLE_ID=MMETSP0811_2 /ASSEMBLY_ACC=CAM_ASM_000667 /LENGTH=62 /DNA_ID=CAMNT_0015501759 /DNA_START=875 /DNA_END=1064 /DNA_ORIENTATION=-